MFDTLRSTFNWTDPNYTPRVNNIQSVAQIFAMAINLMIGVGFSIGLLCIAYSFYMYVMSGGNPDKTSQAWRAFIYGVWGTAVAIGAIALKEIIIRGFGVETTGINELVRGSFF